MTSEPELVAKIANLLANAGWNVDIETGEKGILLDIKATKPDNGIVVIQCKAYKQLAGLRTAREFASVIGYLRQSQPDLHGWLVTTSGFTKRATDELERFRLKGLTVRELSHQLTSKTVDATNVRKRRAQDVTAARSRHRRIFVITPFKDEMDDVFIFGIRWAAERLDAVAERAGDLEHNGEIITEIRAAIEQYDVIVGDTTGGNPNVCYEVGYAHALNKPTILICRKGEKLPFDLQGTNHIMYPNVLKLRAPLEEKLKAALVKKT